MILFPLILIMEWTLKTPCKGDDNLKIIFSKTYKNIYVILISCQVKCILFLNQNQKHRKKLQITQEKFRVLPNFFFYRNSCIVSPSVGTLNTTPIVLRFNVVEFSWLSACVPFYLGFLIIKSLIIVIFHQPYK